MNLSVRYGLLGGVVVVFYFVIAYVANPSLLLSALFQWSRFLFYPLFMWISAKDDCKQNGTKRDFREITRSPFITFLLINVCFWVAYYGLHLYDPTLLISKLQLELEIKQGELSSGVGDPEQANIMREDVQELQKLIQSPQPQPLAPIIFLMCIDAIGGFGLAAGVAALVRNQKNKGG